MKSDHDSWWKERKCFGNSIQILFSGHEETPLQLNCFVEGLKRFLENRVSEKKKILRANFLPWLLARLVHFKLTQSALAVFAVALGAKSPAKWEKMEEGVLCLEGKLKDCWVIEKKMCLIQILD